MNTKERKTAKVYYSKGFEVGKQSINKKDTPELKIYKKAYSDGYRDCYKEVREYMLKTFRITL